MGLKQGARAGRGRFASTMADQAGLTGAAGMTAKEVQKKNEGCCEGGFKEWLAKNWVYVLCVVILVVGIIVEILLIVKPCDEETTEVTSTKIVECSKSCSFEITKEMLSKVNTADKPAPPFNDSIGCETGACAKQFCGHVQGLATNTTAAATGRRLLSASANETDALSDFIWRTSSAKTAQSAELPASTAPPGPIETMKRRRGEAADSSAWYTTQYGSQHGPSIYDNCQNYSKTCCLAVTKIVETLVTKRVETATDVSLVLDGSGSMTCSWCEPKPSHLQNWNKEKEAATKMIDEMAKNLTELTAGMVQFSSLIKGFGKDDVGKTIEIKNDQVTVGGVVRTGWLAAGRAKDVFWGDAKHGDCTGKIESVDIDRPKGAVKLDSSSIPAGYEFENPWNYPDTDMESNAAVEAQQSADLTDVKDKINAAVLRKGATDFGSGLANCYDQISRYGNPKKNKQNKKFCVLITDGIPNDIYSVAMREVCKKMEIPEVPSVCTLRTVMYGIKQAGFIIFGVYVNSKDPALANPDAEKGKKIAREFASCEYRPVCPVTCGQCTASEDQCVDDEYLLKLRSTNTTRNGGQPLLSSCADAKSAGLCEKAGTISTINNNFTNSMDLTIDIGKWSFGYAAKAYKPALAFANTSEASNYDADRCRYFADASSLQEFVDSVGDISKDLVRTVTGVETTEKKEKTSSTAEVEFSSLQTSTEFKTECLGSTLYLLLLPVFAAPLIILLLGKWLNDRRLRRWQQNTDENEEGAEMEEEQEFEADANVEKADLVIKEKEVGDWI